MPIEFRCPQCGKLLRTPDASAGKKGKCPHCQSVNDIPLASTVPQEKPIDPVAPQRPSPRVTPEATDPFGGLQSDPFATAPGPSPPAPQDDPFAGLSSSSPAGSPAPNDLFANLPSSTPAAVASPNPFGGSPSSAGGMGAGFGSQAPVSSNPYSSPTYAASQPSYGYQSGQQAHRGGVVLALGIIALLSGLFGSLGSCCCCFFLPLDVVALAVGIPAVVLGHIDLRKMREGFMDPSGRGMTMAGYVMAIVSLVMVLLGVVLFIVAFAFNIGIQGMQGMQQNQGLKF